MNRAGMNRPLTPAQMERLVEEVNARDGECMLLGVVPHTCQGFAKAGHLIKQSTLKSDKWFKRGAWRSRDDAVFRPITRGTWINGSVETRTLADIAGDARNAMCVCGWVDDVFDNNVGARRAFWDAMPDDLKRPLLEFIREYQLESEAEQRFGLAPYALGG